MALDVQNVRMVPEIKPGIQTLVVCRIHMIEDDGCSVTLLEYGELRGWIATQHRRASTRLKVGKELVAQVISSTDDMITLSQAGCTFDQVHECLEQYAKRCKVHDIIQRLARSVDLDVLQIYTTWGIWDWSDTHDNGNNRTPYDIFEAIAHQDFSDIKWEMYPFCTLPHSHRPLVHRIAQDVFQTSRICTIMGQAYLVYYGMEGINMIKQVLQHVTRTNPDIQVKYDTNGSYRFICTCNALHAPSRIASVNECMQQAVKQINQQAYGQLTDCHIVEEAKQV
jgi:translation initiation factor 2 alpha subunit (eIF-2alpha)